MRQLLIQKLVNRWKLGIELIMKMLITFYFLRNYKRPNFFHKLGNRNPGYGARRKHHGAKGWGDATYHDINNYDKTKMN